MSDQNETPWQVLSDKWYNRIKWIVVICLPAGGTLYFALAQVWEWPNGEQVLGSIIAIQAFLGVVLGISSKSYNSSDARFDGTMTTTDTPTKKIVAVETNFHPDELATKDEVRLKVTPASQ